MKKLRCKKEYGTWYYNKVMPDGDLEFPIYELFNENKMLISTFVYYQNMIYYVKTGVNLED